MPITIKYPKNPNVDTAFVEQDDGTKNRALMIAPQDISTLELPNNPNSTKGYITVDGQKQRVILTADITGGGGGSSLPDQTGHSGEFLTTDGTDASWAAVDALPSQTGNSGKFLTTDGTDASWSDKPLVNKATGNEALAVEGLASGTRSVAVKGDAYCDGSVVVGVYANAYRNTGSEKNVLIGKDTEMLRAANSIAIGRGARVSSSAATLVEHAIQLGSTGSYTYNNDSNTFKVANNNGNFEMMSADGTIPTARLKNAINKYSSMPTAAAGNEGWIVQYTGATDATYTHGYIYECKAQGTTPDETYAWEAVQVQASSGGLPSQTGNSGKFLTTDGTDASWGNLEVSTNSYFLKAKREDDYAAMKCSLAHNINDAEFQIGVGRGKSSYSGADEWSTQSWFSFKYDATTFGSRYASFCAGGNSVDKKYIGNPSIKWTTIYVTKINNGADITVPTTGGTMVVATPPSADGTYVLKATVSSGVVTVAWVAE